MSVTVNEQFSLNWGNHTSHILKEFTRLFTQNEFVDVTLSCEGKKLGAHKMLLSACSVYFHDLFRDNPCQHPIIILKDVKYQVLVDLLHFMYNGEVSIPADEFDVFLNTAELLQVCGLTEQFKSADTNELQTTVPEQSTSEGYKRKAERTKKSVGVKKRAIDRELQPSFHTQEVTEDVPVKGSLYIKTEVADEVLNRYENGESDDPLQKLEHTEEIVGDDTDTTRLGDADYKNDQELLNDARSFVISATSDRPHRLRKPTGPGKKRRKQCKGCYHELRKTLSSQQANKKVCKVTSYCQDCAGEPGYCLDCFNRVHND